MLLLLGMFWHCVVALGCMNDATCELKAEACKHISGCLLSMYASLQEHIAELQHHVKDLGDLVKTCADSNTAAALCGLQRIKDLQVAGATEAQQVAPPLTQAVHTLAPYNASTFSM